MTDQEGIQLIRTASIEEMQCYGITSKNNAPDSKQRQKLGLNRRDFVKLAGFTAGLGFAISTRDLLFPQPAEANWANLINATAEALRLLREIFNWGKPVQGTFTLINPYNVVREGIVVVSLYKPQLDRFTGRVTYVLDGQYLATNYVLNPGYAADYKFDKMPTSTGDKIVQVQTRVSKLTANTVVA